jgi:hypothetical protein
MIKYCDSYREREGERTYIRTTRTHKREGGREDIYKDHQDAQDNE